ncbi:hypothetical protein D3C85_704170 [compost metagenome]
MGEGFGLGLPGHDVHRAARIAAPIEASRRPLEHLDAFDTGGVGRAVAAAVDGEAVLVQLTGGEAANAVGEEGEAAEVVLPGDSASEIQGAVQAGHAQVLEHLRRNHADGLGNVADIGVGARRAGGTGGAIALHRAFGAFLMAAVDLDVIQHEGEGGFRSRGFSQEAQEQAGDGRQVAGFHR